MSRESARTWDLSERRGPVRRIYDDLRSLPRFAWTVCAGISLMSSKALMIDLDLQYPLHLLLINLLVAAACSTLYALLRDTYVPPPRARGPIGLEWVLLLAVAVPMAFSTILSFQAIVHFPNVVTLPMLATISLFVEIAISSTADSKTQTVGECLRLILLFVSCAGVLFYEYRLMVKGLVSAILAALFAGFSRALRTIIADNLQVSIEQSKRINLLYFCSASVIAGLWSGFLEQGFFASISTQHIPLLLVNIPSTAVALSIGWSILLPFDEPEPRASGTSRDRTRVADIMVVIALTAGVGLVSSFTLRRSYTAPSQILCFFAALAIIALPVIRRAQNAETEGKGYRSISEDITLESIGSGGSDISVWEESSVSKERKNSSGAIAFFLSAITIASLLMVFLAANFSGKVLIPTYTPEPTLDTEYVPTTASEVVISMYKEPIHDVVELIMNLKRMDSLAEAKFHIYVKDAGADAENIQQLTGADNVTQVANIGREGETYLYHILNSWDTLAKHTVFLQADVHNPREFYPRIRDYFDPERTGMLSLGFSGHTCNCESCGDAFDWHDTAGLFPKTYNRIYGNSSSSSSSSQCSNVLLSYKGQFIASAKRIRGIDKAIYSDLRDAFVNPESWAHSDEYLQGRKDTMSQPQFGYTMERMWNLLLQCSGMEIAWKCSTLISGTRQGGSFEDCQCFDPMARDLD
ncbi:hypothetical protein BDV96DRAFT_134442 [Lophiotrema nucula]|uniref:Uncharacterized protein n=1 Tax=Lophiotrema nucula TaxID=690887 RepID=A0A6A5ZSH9_9PLEO|nr:hypothetical protein BDV96DRAFT_134442 [Lophiotrema nucula]